MHLLATTKLYELMSLDEYTAAQTAYITQLALHYKQKTDAERWAIILEKFAGLAPQYEPDFRAFQTQRIESDPSLFNLSLAACLDYFEHFYFLYTTENPRFKLSEHSKTLLLGAIKEAMDTCETGKSTRFEMVLQLYRTDTNWVTNLLSKQRYLLLMQLQDAYNEVNRVPQSFQVHILKIMTQLAADEGLGIEIVHKVKDVFAGYMSRAKIKEYFLDKYPGVFCVEYEEAVINTLSQHLIYEMNEFYCYRQANWETNEIIIPVDRVQEFGSFLDNRLGLSNVNIFDSLGVLDGSGCFHLKNKNDCLAILQGFIQQKLVAEGYFKTLPLHQNWSDDIQLFKGVKQSDFRELDQALTNYNGDDSQQLFRLMIKHRNILLLYPELLLSHIEAHPELLFLLPKELKTNAYFIEQVVSKLGQTLLAALASNNEDLYNQLSSHLFILTKNNSDYLNQLPYALVSHPPFARQLVEKDGLLLKNLPDALQDNEDIVETAIQQNHLALLYAPMRFKIIQRYVGLAVENSALEGLDRNSSNFGNYVRAINDTTEALKNRLPISLQVFFPPIENFHEDNDDITKMLSNLKKMEAMSRLMSPEKMSTRSVARLAQMITPDELIAIIEARNTAQLPPLPYCSNVDRVNNFLHSLKGQHLNDWANGYLSVKKQACAFTRTSNGHKLTHEKAAVEFLAKSDTWFMAMLQYQSSNYGAYASRKQFFMQLKQAVKAIGLVLWSLAKITAIIAIGASLMIAAAYVIGFLPVFVPLVLLGLLITSSLLARASTNRVARGILNGIGMASVIVLAPHYLIALIGGLTVIHEAIKLVYLIKDVGRLVASVFSRSFKSIFSDSDFNRIAGPDADIRTKCEETITRLALMDNPVAQEKADILETVWSTINTGIEEEGDDQAIGHKLIEPQTFSYQGQEHCLSFYQVAGISRGSQSFVVPADSSPSRHGFFKTTTQKLLALEPDLEVPAASL